MYIFQQCPLSTTDYDSELPSPQPSERATVIARSTEVMARVGSRLVQEKRAAVLAEARSADAVEKKSVVGKDLLSVLSESPRFKPADITY